MKKILLLLLALVLAFSLFACEKEEKAPEVPDTDEGSGEQEEKEEKAEEFELDLSESDTRKIWSFGSLTYVFECDGENITKTELYTDCDTADVAKATAESLKSKYKDDASIALIEVKGKYVHSVYAEDSMPYKTLSELEAAKELTDRTDDGGK